MYVYVHITQKVVWINRLITMLVYKCAHVHTQCTNRKFILGNEKNTLPETLFLIFTDVQGNNFILIMLPWRLVDFNFVYLSMLLSNYIINISMSSISHS